MDDWVDKGYTHLYGMGAKRNTEKALECFRKGAEAGDMFACWAIYETWSNGVSLISDEDARDMCKRAAELGHEKAAVIMRISGGSWGGAL
jgi:TPR repeat protein